MREENYKQEGAASRSGRSVQSRDSLLAGLSGGGLEPIKIVRMVMRRWIWVLFLGCIGAACGWFYASRETPIYEARADIEMSVRRPKVISGDVLFEDGTSSRDTGAIF